MVIDYLLQLRTLSSKRKAQATSHQVATADSLEDASAASSSVAQASKTPKHANSVRQLAISRSANERWRSTTSGQQHHRQSIVRRSAACPQSNQVDSAAAMQQPGSQKQATLLRPAIALGVTVLRLEPIGDAGTPPGESNCSSAFASWASWLYSLMVESVVRLQAGNLLPAVLDLPVLVLAWWVPKLHPHSPNSTWFESSRFVRFTSGDSSTSSRSNRAALWHAFHRLVEAAQRA